MKVLHLIRSIDPAGGGPVEGIRQLSGHHLAEGHKVEVASLDSPSAPWMKNFSLPIYPLGPGLGRYGFSTKWTAWLRENVCNYDVVIINGIWQYQSYGAWRVLREMKMPYVLFTHGMLDPWFKRRYPFKHLKKWIYWPWAEYRVIRDASAVLFTCEEERVLARRSFWLYKCNEIVVNFGTAGPQGDAAAQSELLYRKFPQLQGKRIALFLSRLHTKKGCNILIEAFAKTMALDPSWRLVMAGPDQIGWKANLEGLAAKLGVADCIVWAGMITGDLKWGAFRAAEIFVLPSHSENFGIVVAEALACGTPVLISDKVNIWREIQAEGAGLVAPDTLQGTIETLRQWSRMPLDERQAMRGRARSCFLRRFEIQSAASILINTLSNFLPNGAARGQASLQEDYAMGTCVPD